MPRNPAPSLSVPWSQRLLSRWLCGFRLPEVWLWAWRCHRHTEDSSSSRVLGPLPTAVAGCAGFVMPAVRSSACCLATWLPGPAGPSSAPADTSTAWVSEEESEFLPALHVNPSAQTSEHSGSVQLPQPIPSFSRARLTGLTPAQYLPLLPRWPLRCLTFKVQKPVPSFRDWKRVGGFSPLPVTLQDPCRVSSCCVSARARESVISCGASSAASPLLP